MNRPNIVAFTRAFEAGNAAGAQQVLSAADCTILISPKTQSQASFKHLAGSMVIAYAEDGPFGLYLFGDAKGFMHDDLQSTLVVQGPRRPARPRSGSQECTAYGKSTTRMQRGGDLNIGAGGMEAVLVVPTFYPLSFWECDLALRVIGDPLRSTERIFRDCQVQPFV